jgi:hypothetical protein
MSPSLFTEVGVLMEVAMAKESKRGSVPQIVGTLLVFFFLVCGFYYLMARVTSGNDVLECKAITGLVLSRHAIPESVSTPGRPAIFCDAKARGLLSKRFAHLRIYGVTDKSQQDSILETLEARQPHSREVTVAFYEKENWKTWSDSGTGKRGGEREPEIPIREASIR